MTQLSLDGLGKLARELSDVSDLLAFVGEKAKDVIEEEGKRDTGGDLILSNFARGRVRMTVDVNIRGGSLTLKGEPPGPWMLLEAGSHKSGWWEPRRGRSKIKFPDGQVRNYVRHGAVRARNTFTRASKRINQDAKKWADDWLTQQIRKAA